MNITIHYAFLPHTDAEAAVAFYRDTLGFEIRQDVGYKDMRWITVSGKRDSHPDRDGIAGMKRTADWLKEQGAVVIESIEDPDEGHGALMRNPKNARRVLDSFFNQKE